MPLALGIDTGGTYTDGIVIDLEQRKIFAKAKALTTRQDLAVGIRNCINSLQIEQETIKMVAISTTLATNSIVEGHGAEVGLILIGSDPIKNLPVKNFAVIPGGHDTKGREMSSLDLTMAKSAIERFKGKVSAVAVSGYFSVRNPEHELQVRELIRDVLSVPVVCAHELTTALGFHERTVTAALNACLISVIAELLEAVEKVLFEAGIKAPVMIVKGDGTLMSENIARVRPIETILSGPAASIIGATFLTGQKDALVLDMGGTTTDIAILHSGVPHINREGALVGGWLTRVRSAEINTYGVGGDSYLQITKDGKIKVGPERVLPLAVLAAEYPYLLEQLQKHQGRKSELLTAEPTDCYLLLKDTELENLTFLEKEVLKYLHKGPASLITMAGAIGEDPNLFNLKRLVNAGIIAKASLTPTDILHARGTYSEWNEKAAIAGSKLLAKRMGKSLEEFLDFAMESIINELCFTILQSVANFEGNAILLKESQGAEYFLNKFLRPKAQKFAECQYKMKLPIVAIGAPIGAYLPQVSEKLNAELIIPESAEVANAIGAAAGQVMETVKVLIREGFGQYLLFAPWGREKFKSLDEAKTYALDAAQKFALDLAEKAGSKQTEILVSLEDIYANSNVCFEQRVYIETKIEVNAVGSPGWND
ncbi:hydantoinase/oxoprolinase family protein [Bacillota bacterium LX-D]|nr:hydantoinase/oxoprolinase family protein [Bacillota bacterium LX-D]